VNFKQTTWRYSPENGTNTFLQNTGELQTNYMALQPRKWNLSFVYASQNQLYITNTATGIETQ
jgi:hypothetical protein